MNSEIPSPQSKARIFAVLPPPWPEDLTPLIQGTVTAWGQKLVVLDDDPTGTQTVHGVPVLTGWDAAALQAEFENHLPCFYILTNSRSLSGHEARRMNLEIAAALKAASKLTQKDFVLVSRSDSTLRGHYPLETDALAEILEGIDATIIIPYFEAGGRYTINNIHYVAEGDDLIPAAQTAFARDAVFGYRNSNLCDWVEEKTGGRVRSVDVQSIDLPSLRQAAPHHEPTRRITVKLLSLPKGCVCVVNACHHRDIEFFALGSLMAERAGARFIYRTAAQFVAARLGIKPTALWHPPKEPSAKKSGGLTVVGSYVPKTTQQLEPVLADSCLVKIELHVGCLLQNEGNDEIAHAASVINQAIENGQDAVIYTSRQLVTASSTQDHLTIGQKISSALVEIVRKLESRPRYLIAKGGITSSDLATKALGVKRSMVLGQILPGVPIWELGFETKFPGIPYVVFPGNVGGPNALREAIQCFKI